MFRAKFPGQVKDAIRIELARQQRLQMHGIQSLPRRDAYTNVYTNAAIVDVAMEPYRGLELVIGFDQPEQLQGMINTQRRDWWNTSRRLPSDSLIRLIGLNGSIRFLTVFAEPFRPRYGPINDAQRKSIELHEKYAPWYYPDRAHVIARPVDDNHARELFRDILAGNAKASSLVEFRGLWLSAFLPTLKVLQRMSRSLDMPFADIMTPVAEPGSRTTYVEIGPPNYTTNPGFYFDLSTIIQAHANITTFTLGDSIFETVRALENVSSLDRPQLFNLVCALSKRLALIPGPLRIVKANPGIELIQTLLRNEPTAGLGPILFVTYTNNALDQDMERLHDAGVSQLIRIGGGSRSERMAGFDLRAISQQHGSSDIERREQDDAWDDMQRITEEMNGILQYIGYTPGYRFLADYLQEFNPSRHQQLFGHVNDIGSETTNVYLHEALDLWLNGWPRDEEDPRPVTELRGVHIWDMSARERHELHSSWKIGIADSHLNSIMYLLESYNHAKAVEHQVKAEKDFRALQGASVIGVTMSGLAKNIDLLKRVNAKVLVCDEAGDAPEAKLLTALLPSLEHAILMGDQRLLHRHEANSSQ